MEEGTSDFGLEKTSKRTDQVELESRDHRYLTEYGNTSFRREGQLLHGDESRYSNLKGIDRVHIPLASPEDSLHILQDDLNSCTRLLLSSIKNRREVDRKVVDPYSDDEGDSLEVDQPCKHESKRARVAESHRMSERRRRNRINEKLKTLQKLIPNSEKIDKASILEEAADYLKTLQWQLQIMSSMSALHSVSTPAMAPAYPPNITPMHPSGLFWTDVGAPMVQAGDRSMGFEGSHQGRRLYCGAIPSWQTTVPRSIIFKRMSPLSIGVCNMSLLR